jgi:hypothetical protein
VERRVDGADDLAERSILGGGPPAARRARQAEEETVGCGVGDDACSFAEKEELDECALAEVARADVRQLEDRPAGVRDGRARLDVELGGARFVLWRRVVVRTWWWLR